MRAVGGSWGRRGLIGLALAAALPLSGCMTTLFLATDYEERTEKQWLTAFLTDLAIGGALIGTSFAVGEDGEPDWRVLAPGAAAAGFALLLMPLAQYPRPAPPVRSRPAATRGRSAPSAPARPPRRAKPQGR